MSALRGLAILLAVALAALVALAVAARLSDGPIGPLPGGPLRSGEWVESADVDWSFARSVEEVELQLLEPARSRTTWILVHEGRPYVGAGLLDVPLWKQWPREALEDGRAVLRIEGRRYPLRAVKVEDPELYRELTARAAEKYDPAGGEAPEPDTTWFFRLEPRRRSD